MPAQQPQPTQDPWAVVSETPASNPQQAQTQTSQPTGDDPWGVVSEKPAPIPSATIRATPEPTGISGHVQRWSENVANDIKYGTDLTGIGTLLKKMGAHGVYAGNPEAVGDFMASLPLGLLRSTKGGAEVAQGKTWQGTKDVVGGALQASQIPGSFVAPEASEAVASTAGKAVEGAASTASKAVRSVKAPFSTKTIQPGLQQGIRDAMGAVADENGVAKPTAASIRDVVQKTADQVYAKSKSLYSQIDEATGGRFQRFEDALQNINQKLRESVGLDDDKEAELLAKKAETEAAQQKVFAAAKAKGIDPTLVDEANQNYRKAHALYDLDTQVKKATSGMRPNVGDATSAAKNPEFVDPSKLFNRVNNLYDSGRLQEAVGEQGANNLLEHANNNLVRHKQVLRNVNAVKTVGKAVGIGSALAAGAKVTHIFDPEAGLLPTQ